MRLAVGDTLSMQYSISLLKNLNGFRRFEAIDTLRIFGSNTGSARRTTGLEKITTRNLCFKAVFQIRKESQDGVGQTHALVVIVKHSSCNSWAVHCFLCYRGRKLRDERRLILPDDESNPHRSLTRGCPLVSNAEVMQPKTRRFSGFAWDLSPRGPNH